MLVEALWRNFKRMDLHQYNRPRVDFATYALVTQGIAPYRVRFNRIVRNPRDGRAKMLRGDRLPIMRAWLALLKRPIIGSYKTDTGLWLCDCGTQKYHSYLLCKHIVQDLPFPALIGGQVLCGGTHHHSMTFESYFQRISGQLHPSLLLWAHDIGLDSMLLHYSAPCLLLHHKFWYVALTVSM